MILFALVFFFVVVPHPSVTFHYFISLHSIFFFSPRIYSDLEFNAVTPEFLELKTKFWVQCLIRLVNLYCCASFVLRS